MKTNEPTILIVIIRDIDRRIISRVGNAGPRDSALLVATANAWNILRDEPRAVRAEVHNFEDTDSIYTGKPLAVFTLDDVIDKA